METAAPPALRDSHRGWGAARRAWTGAALWLLCTPGMTIPSRHRAFRRTERPLEAGGVVAPRPWVACMPCSCPETLAQPQALPAALASATTAQQLGRAHAAGPTLSSQPSPLSPCHPTRLSQANSQSCWKQVGSSSLEERTSNGPQEETGLPGWGDSTGQDSLLMLRSLGGPFPTCLWATSNWLTLTGTLVSGRRL